MTDQNQVSASKEHSENGGEKNGQGRRNYHRRYHKHHNRPHPEKGENQGNAAPTEQPRETVREPAEKQAETARTEKNQSHHNQNGNNRKNDRSGNKKHHGNHNGHRRGPESRPYDPYEAPGKQEIELSELRAQIVLKAADGTVPTAYSAPKAEPAPAEEPEKKSEKIEAPETEPEASASVEAADAPAETAPPVEVIGVRFRSAGKMYYFDPNGLKAKKGDSVIVETTRGPEFGDVCLANTMIRSDHVVSPLRPLLRVATPADIAQNAENREKEKKALGICQEKIAKHGLEMKLIEVQYAFDGSKLLFYFAAEGRVDFRELVKDLASVFRTRIELRQIGIRDEAKILGGIGACGRPLCCSTFLPDFAQVSIKMAKDQNLSLNSAKISGVCGRLMCCLRYESEIYAEEIRKTPANDSLVRTADGVGVVIGSTPLAGTVRVVLKDQPDTSPRQYHRDDVTVIGKEKKGNDRKEGADS